MEKIEIKNLTFTYPEKSSPALSDVNLSVKQGEFVCLIGKSGSGKSTLLRHLKPSLAPHGKKSGSIYFGELSEEEQYTKIGFLLQNPDNQIVCDKVWHELAFGLENMGIPSSEIRARIAEMSSFFGIQNWFHKDTCDLSGGEKQLLNLAAVMVMQPSLLILDEPTSQLDPISAERFFGTISKINTELGTTIILSEHRLEEVFPLSNRVLVMENGKIVADGTPHEIGKILNDTKSDLLFGLPTPMRCYFSKKNSLPCPVTVSDGKKWLSEMQVEKTDFPEKTPISTDIILDVRDLYFRYDKNKSDVLKGLNFKVKKGELYAIVGGNGVGKTTALSAVSGILKPQRGKVLSESGKKIALLSQNPQHLFAKNTLWEDLSEMTTDKDKIIQILELLELEHLKNSHPYDLSGGEQQRAALAKILLTVPDILLLDEPTKGLDAYFKKTLADILQALKASGLTVIAVSHDIEFCASYADRVGLFFDGNIVSEGEPREFFSKTGFYTTAAKRMAHDAIPNAITAEDIIYAIGGEAPPKPKKQFPKLPKKNEPPAKPPKKRHKKRTLVTFAVLLFLIPLTIFFGLEIPSEHKYLFTSLLVISETLFPFFLMFEKRKPHARELVLISVLCAIASLGRAAFAMTPQFKPVTAIVITAGACLGGEVGFLVGAVTGFVSNFFFGQGAWALWQMFAWGIIGLLSGIIFLPTKKKPLPLCVFGFFASLVIYGGIMNPASLFMAQLKPTPALLAAYYLNGLPLDLIHAVSTVFFLAIGAKPIVEQLERIKIKYGILEL